MDKALLPVSERKPQIYNDTLYTNHRENSMLEYFVVIRNVTIFILAYNN